MLKKKSSRGFVEINIYELGLYVLLVILFEIIQIFFNQPYLLCIAHVIILMCFIILFFQIEHPKIGCFILILYDILETSSWITIGTNITFQIINAIDFQHVTKSHPEFMLHAGIGLFLNNQNNLNNFV